MVKEGDDLACPRGLFSGSLASGPGPGLLTGSPLQALAGKFPSIDESDGWSR